MKPSVLLPISSLLSILLLTIHITDDIVRGISKAESSNIALVVLVILLYGTLVLSERRSGHVIMLIVGFFAVLMPVMHMRGAHYPDIARSRWLFLRLDSLGAGWAEWPHHSPRDPRTLELTADATRVIEAAEPAKLLSR